MQAQDYMRQKRERTGTTFFYYIKTLNISTGMLLKEKKKTAKFNFAYGGCVALGIDACPSHVTLIVTLARVFVLLSSSQFLREREAASSLDIRYVPSQSSVEQQS